MLMNCIWSGNLYRCVIVQRSVHPWCFQYPWAGSMAWQHLHLGSGSARVCTLHMTAAGIQSLSKLVGGADGLQVFWITFVLVWIIFIIVWSSSTPRQAAWLGSTWKNRQSVCQSVHPAHDDHKMSKLVGG